jgi:hypothetical protein
MDWWSFDLVKGVLLSNIEPSDQIILLLMRNLHLVFDIGC